MLTLPPLFLKTPNCPNEQHIDLFFYFQAARLLGPPASFEASKLKVVFMGEGLNNYSAIIPRTYILSHCDFTANLTLTISNVINLDQVQIPLVSILGLELCTTYF